MAYLECGACCVAGVWLYLDWLLEDDPERRARAVTLEACLVLATHVARLRVDDLMVSTTVNDQIKHTVNLAEVGLV